MEEKFCGECGTKLIDNKCPKCSVEIKKMESSFGWGVLGFFVPIVGLILFLVWRKDKKSSSKAAGIGALIGGILCILVSVLAFVFFTFGKGSSNETDIVRTVKATKTNYSKYSIKDDYYLAYWYEQLLDIPYGDYTIKVVNDNNKDLFSIVFKNNKYYLVTNSNDKVELKNGYIVSSYRFYYTGDVLIFEINDNFNDFYFYDYNSKKLVHAFNGNEDKYDGMFVQDIIVDNNKNLVFKGYVNGINTDEKSSGKSSIALRFDNGMYNSLEALQADLTKYNLDDFILSNVLTYNYTNNSYSATPVVEEETILEAYKKKNGITDITIERTKDCVGNVTKSNNNSHELVFKENTDKTCKTVSYKVNDDFTVKYELTDSNSSVSFVKYINGNKIDDGYYPEFDAGWTYYISGKTLVTHEWATDLGANVYLVNTKGEIYNMKDNKNQLNMENMTEKGYKVEENGSLVITGVRHSNQCALGVIINGKCVDESFCDSSYETFASKNNLPNNYDYSAEYTYKIGNDGLFSMNYSSKKSTKTLKEYHNSICIQR